MTATATASTWQPSSSRSQSRTSRPSTTTRGHSAMSIAQSMPPPLSTPMPAHSPTHKFTQSPSTGYFGLAVNDESVPPESNPGQHTKQNWIYSNSSRGSRTSPVLQTNDQNPSLEAFRRQSEVYGFNLDKNFSALRKATAGGASDASSSHPRAGRNESAVSHTTTLEQSPSFQERLYEQRDDEDGLQLDMPRRESPTQMSPVSRTIADFQNARLSLPTSELQDPSRLMNPKRSDTMPANNERVPTLTTPAEVATILKTHPGHVLVLDLRVYAQYATARVNGALNLCIPTTLLKRPTFTVQKLADTFSLEQDKRRFEQWQSCSHIVVYDATSAQAKDAVMPFSILNKFFNLGWNGRGIVVKGGFHAFSKSHPGWIDKGPVHQNSGSPTQPVSLSATSSNQVPVAGGCAMPATKSAANPFFGNIRQNMDLLDGVGQMPIKKPSDMSKNDEKALPDWLREASGTEDQGRQVSDKFLCIERSEQKRMQQALSGEVHYGTPSEASSDTVRVAGIEKGSKNRYNNIFPYDHSRVKIQEIPMGGCDYINANYVQAAYSSRRYIATQAPIPATFEDFWKVVWEQDVRVILMLTAESEGGQLKSHPYWITGEYGSLKIKKLSERQSSLEKTKKAGPARPPLGTRRSTQPYTHNEKKDAQERKSSTSEPPTVTVRHLALSHSAHPFQPMREITQLQYTQWPDFGAPANPAAILGLIDQVNKYVRSTSSPTEELAPDDTASEDRRPILVHCSAGCGRTGTFCTVDSVIDMLKRQMLERHEHEHEHEHDGMDVDVLDDWISRDDVDLVAKTVNDFRHQRLSMVQNLRQFVLCYESILQWIVSQEHTGQDKHTTARGKSFQGSMA